MQDIIYFLYMYYLSHVEAFKSLLQANPEYLLLFNESQNAATSCPPDSAQEHTLLATGSNLSSPNVTPAHLSSPANGTNSASRTLQEANNDIIVVIDWERETHSCKYE